MTEKEIEEKSSDEEEQESKLEEEIEEVEEIKNELEIIEDNQFNEFLQPPTKSSAPVLEMENSPMQESLERGVKGLSISRDENEEKEGVNYGVNNNEDNKYSTSQDINYGSSNTPDRIDMENVGREKQHLREVGPASLGYPKTKDSFDSYQVKSPDRIDMENVGRDKEKLKEVGKIDMKYDTNN